MTVLGSVLPSVIEKFNIDNTEAGTLFVFLSAGLLGGNIIFGPIVDRFGYKPLLIICSALAAFGFIGIAFSPSMFFLGASFLLSGFAGAAINGGTNALVSDISEGKRGSRLTLLGVFFGIGAFGVPLLLGTLLDKYSYEFLISTIGLSVIFPLILFAVLRFPPPKNLRGFPITAGIDLAKNSTLILFGFILLIQSGLEMSMGGWSATFFSEVIQVPSHRAVLFLSLFWMGLTMNRIFLSYLLLKFQTPTIMNFSLACSFTGSIIMLSASTPFMGALGLILTGMGFAAVFPVVLAYVGDLFVHLSGTAFSIVFVMALMGGMTMPYLIGVISDIYNLRVAMMMIPLAILISVILFRISDNRSAQAKGQPAPPAT